MEIKKPMAKTPCFGCNKRTFNCHCSCEDYRQFQETRREYLLQRQRETEQASAFIEHVRRTAARKKQRYGAAR